MGDYYFVDHEGNARNITVAGGMLSYLPSPTVKSNLKSVAVCTFGISTVTVFPSAKLPKELAVAPTNLADVEQQLLVECKTNYLLSSSDRSSCDNHHPIANQKVSFASDAFLPNHWRQGKVKYT